MKTKLTEWTTGDREYNQFTDILNGTLTFVFFGLAATMVLAVWLQMLVRWIISPYFGLSMPWTGSIATLAMVMLTFIGAGVASRDNDHVRISILLDKLSGNWRSLANVANSILVAVFVSVFILGAINQAIEMGGRQYQTLPATAPFTRDWLYYAATAGGLLMLLFTARDLLQNILNILHSNEGDISDVQEGKP